MARGNFAQEGRSPLKVLMMRSLMIERSLAIVLFAFAASAPTWSSEPTTAFAELTSMVENAIGGYRPISQTRLAETHGAVARRLAELERFLASGPSDRQGGWTRFLRLEGLREEISLATAPRWQPLLTTYNQLNSGQPGLHRNEFTQLREALEAYLALLQFTETAPGRLAEGAAELRDEFRRFDGYLISGGDRKRENWHAFLAWDETYVTDDVPLAAEKLMETYRKLDHPDVPTDVNSHFRRLSRGLGKYLELAQMNRATQAPELYARRMQALAKTLTDHASAPNNSTTADLYQHILWLERTGYLPEVAVLARQKFARANLRFDVESQILTEQIAQSLYDCQQVRRCFEGSRVSGTAETTGHVVGKVLPSENSIAIELQLRGTTQTNTLARQRKVAVATTGQTQILAAKRLDMTPEGLLTEPATASTCTRLTTEGVCIDRKCSAGNRLIRRIAYRRARESRGRAEAEQSRETREATERQLDQQVLDMTAQVEQRMEDALSRAGIGDRSFLEGTQLRSTAKRVFGMTMVTLGRYLGAETPPPSLATTGNANVQLHQSVVNNVLTDLIGGVKVDSDRLVQQLRDGGLDVPEELLASADTDSDEWWSLTFDASQPASIRFDANQVTLAIRGKRFQRGSQSIREPLEIAATYALELDEARQLVGVRQGDVEVTFLNSPGRLSTRQITYKTFIRRKTAAVFAEKFSTEDLPEMAALDRLRDLVVHEFDATQGWFSVSLDLRELFSR